MKMHITWIDTLSEEDVSKAYLFGVVKDYARFSDFQDSHLRKWLLKFMNYAAFKKMIKVWLTGGGTSLFVIGISGRN